MLILKAAEKANRMPTLSFCRKKKQNAQNRTKQIEIDFMYIMTACPLNVELLLLLPTLAGDCECEQMGINQK